MKQRQHTHQQQRSRVEWRLYSHRPHRILMLLTPPPTHRLLSPTIVICFTIKNNIMRIMTSISGWWRRIILMWAWKNSRDKSKWMRCSMEMEWIKKGELMKRRSHFFRCYEHEFSCVCSFLAEFCSRILKEFSRSRALSFFAFLYSRSPSYYLIIGSCWGRKFFKSRSRF